MSEAECTAIEAKVVSPVAVGLGDEIRYTEEGRSEVVGIVSKIQTTESGRKVYAVTQELICGNGYDLVTARLYEGNAVVEIIRKGSSFIMDNGTFVGGLLPDVYLGLHLANMKKRAIEARDAAEAEALLPKFLINQPSEFCDAPADLIARMNKSEARGEVAIITGAITGLSSRYALYEPDYKVEFDGDWMGTSRGPAGHDPIRMGLRYRSEDDIVAMTHAAKKAFDDRRAEIDAMWQADKDLQAAAEVARAKDAELRCAHTKRLSSVRFKKEQLTLSLGGGSSQVTVDADVFLGAAVHKSTEGLKKAYVVTHIATSTTLVKFIPNKAMGNLIAARLATSGDLALIKSRDDVKLPVMAVFKEIAMAIRDSAASRCGIDPLIHPEFDAHLLQ
jgi:hypothetical protein